MRTRTSLEGRLDFILKTVGSSYGFLRLLLAAQWARKGISGAVSGRNPGVIPGSWWRVRGSQEVSLLDGTGRQSWFDTSLSLRSGLWSYLLGACASPQPQQQAWRARKMGSSSSTVRALSVENVFQATYVVPKQRCPWNLELGRWVISAHCEISQTSLAPLCLLELTCVLICLSCRIIGCLKARNMSYTFLYSSSSHGKSVINWSLNYTKYSFYCKSGRVPYAFSHLRETELESY